MLERRVPDSPLITYEAGALPVPPWAAEEQEEGGVHFYVVGPDPRRIGEALNAARASFTAVAEDGRIVAEEEIGPGILRTPDAEPWDIPYTPNYVFPVQSTADGAYVAVDTKGEVYGAMMRTMVALIVEELTARSLRARFAVPPADVEESARELYPE